MTLDQFIASEMGKPFVWGETDCASRVNRWITSQTGKSPRDAVDYASVRAGLNTIRAMRRGMTGFEPTRQPIPGDVGIVAMGRLICAAIYTGPHWVAWSETGMMIHRSPRVLMAWKV
jgi:hypothetical protein